MAPHTLATGRSGRVLRPTNGRPFSNTRGTYVPDILPRRLPLVRGCRLVFPCPRLPIDLPAPPLSHSSARPSDQLVQCKKINVRPKEDVNVTNPLNWCDIIALHFYTPHPHYCRIPDSNGIILSYVVSEIEKGIDKSLEEKTSKSSQLYSYLWSLYSSLSISTNEDCLDSISKVYLIDTTVQYYPIADIKNTFINTESNAKDF